MRNNRRASGITGKHMTIILDGAVPVLGGRSKRFYLVLHLHWRETTIQE